MKDIKTIENCATKIEETGLKRHLSEDMPELKDVHHYVIQLDYQKSEEDELIDNLPESFEVCFENENKDGTCDSVWMFYLEDQTEEDVEKIVNWLKEDKHWSTYEP
jgi:hypothetical protein